MKWVMNIEEAAIYRDGQPADRKKLIKGMTIGAPLPTAHFTVEQLLSEGFVGLYSSEPDVDKPAVDSKKKSIIL